MGEVLVLKIIPFLGCGKNGGNPIVDYQNMTLGTMAHADYEPGMELVYRWYIDVFARSPNKLSNTDTDGDNLLDTTLILCISEFSSGRHWNSNLPIPQQEIVVG